MSLHLYDLPTTGAISFSELCTDMSAGKLYTSYISDATQSRANLRAVLKESKRTQDAEKDYLKLVKVLRRLCRC
jgi:Ca2+-binding EF-hand superfamily protein